MNNMPPYKSDDIHVSLQNIKANGFDKLVLAVNGEWKNLAWFSYFSELKKEAQDSSLDVPGAIKTDGSIEWAFRMKPNGANGFTWLLISNDFNLKVGQWAISRERPNVMAEISAEMLWRMGAQETCSFISGLLEDMGLDIKTIKPSRVDLCLDILFPKSAWDMDLIKYAVTMATERAGYLQKAEKTKGLSFGKGAIMARLYDKGLEIKQHSHKFWMFDIWGILEIPKDKIMVRIEFELKREILKDTGIDALSDLFEKQQNLWAYCTKNWLKFQDNVGAHRDKRNTMTWWEVVQDGYEKAQGATPCIREHVLRLDMERLTRQAYGLLLSLIACHLELTKEKPRRVGMSEVLSIYVDCLNQIGKNAGEMNEKIHERRTKFKRAVEKGGE